MTEAAATLVLDIDSKKAVSSLTALEEKYAATQAKLAQPINVAGGIERSTAEIKGTITTLAADVAAMNDRLSNGMRGSGEKAAKSFNVGWQAGLGAFSYDFKYDEAMRAKVVEQGQKLGAEAGKALNAGLTTSAVEAGRRFGAAISEGTASGIKKAEALVASYDAYLSNFGATTANTKFGANFASDGAYRAQIEAAKQRVAALKDEAAQYEILSRQFDNYEASKKALAEHSAREAAAVRQQAIKQELAEEAAKWKTLNKQYDDYEASKKALAEQHARDAALARQKALAEEAAAAKELARVSSTAMAKAYTEASKTNATRNVNAYAPMYADEYAAEQKAAANLLALKQQTLAQQVLENEAVAREVAMQTALQALNEKGFDEARRKANLELRKQETAEIAKQIALQKAADESASRWAAATPSQRASATLAAAQSIYSNKNSSYLSGLAGSSEAASEAASLGSVAAAKAQVDALSNAHKNLKPQVEATANAQKMWNAAANEGHAFARGLSGSLGTLWMTYGSLVPLMAGAALAGGFKSATTAGAEFAYQLTFVKALGGESAQSIAEIGSAALALSKSSMYGPGELANGLRMLSQAGLDAQQSMRALQTVMNLATVGEMSMEQASLTLVGVMNAFGKSLNDLPHIGDMFAKAAALSQTSVNGMTEAMKAASVVHDQYGASVEDTATAITLLAKVNITGTAAGTAYRNMLKDLYTPSAEAAKTLKKLGIETKDANGDLREASAIIADLKAELANFTQASQTDILGKIFSERGGKEAIQMLTSVGKTWDDLKAKISNSDGFMNDVATQLEMTTKGRFEQALNTFKANMVNAFNASEGPVRNLADALRNLADSPAFIAGINGIVGAMASLATTLVNLTPAIVAFGAAWTTLKVIIAGGELIAGLRGIGAASSVAAGAMGSGGLAGVLSTLVGPAGWVVLGAVALGTMAVALYNVASASSPAVSKAQEFIDVLKRETEKLKASNDELAKRNNLMRNGSTAPSSQSERQGLEAERASLSSSMAGATEARQTYLQHKIDKIDAQLKELSKAEGAAMSEQYRGRLETLSNIILTAKQDIARLSEDAKFAGKTVDLTALNNYVKVFSRKDGVTQAEARQFSEQVQRLITDAQKKMLGSGNQTYPADTKEETAALKDAFNARIQALRGYIQQYSEEYNQFVSEQTAKRNEGAISELQLLTSTWEEKSSIIQKEMIKQQQIIDAYGTQKNSSAEVQQERNKLEKMQSELLKARTDYEGKVAKLHERTNDDILALEKQLGGKLETEYDKQVTAMQGSYAKVLKDLLLDWGDASSKLQAATIVGDGAQVATYTDRLKELEAQIERVKTAGVNALTAASKKDAIAGVQTNFNAISTELTNLGAEVDKLEADMERDGGWISRIFNTGEITDLIQQRLPELQAQLATTREQLAQDLDFDEKGRLTKQAAALQAQINKFANYVPKVWKDVVGKIDKTFHDGFAAIFAKGKTDWDAFGKSLAASFKTTVVDAIYQMFARPFVMNVVVSIAGTMGVNGLASAAESQGSLGSVGNIASAGNTAYNLYNGGSSLFSDFATSGVGSALGLSTGLSTSLGVAGGAGTTMGASAALAAAEATSAGATAVSSLGSTIGAAIPYVGWALLAVTALTSALGKGGGPKTEGDAYATLASDGALMLAASDRSGDNWITGTNSNAVVESLLTPIGTSVANLISSMGGSALGINLNLGYSTDPNGTAQDNIQSGVMDANGNYVYRNGRNAERGTYATELNLEVQRMMVAAVQASDVSQIYKDVAGSVDLYTASATELQTVLSNLTAITSLRTAFDNLGLGADNLSMSLINAAGGTSTLATNLDSYYQNFYSTAERNANTLSQVSDALSDLGLAMPTTREGFRALVDAQDLTTESGQKAFATLMSLNSAFASVVSATEATTTAVKTLSETIKDSMSSAQTLIDSARERVQSAYDTESSALETTISSLESFGDSIKSLLNNLETSDLSPYATPKQFSDVASDYELTLKKAILGDADAQSRLPDLANSYLTLARQMYGSGDAYTALFEQVMSDMSGVASSSDTQLSMAKQQLESLNDQAAGILTLNDTVLSFADAVESYLDVIAANSSAASSGITLTNGQQITDPTSEQKYVSNLYSSLFGRNADAEGLNYWAGQLSSGKSSSTVTTDMLNSATTTGSIDQYVTQQYKQLLGKSPDSEGLAYWVKQIESGAMAASDLSANLQWAANNSDPTYADRYAFYQKYSRWPAANAADRALFQSAIGRVPKFESGGYHAGGLRLVGETGVEIEATGPARYWNASQTSQMISGANPEMLAELRALREEVKALRQQQQREHQEDVSVQLAVGEKVVSSQQSSTYAATLKSRYAA